MSKSIKQYRYYNDNNIDNYPANLQTKENLLENKNQNIFTGDKIIYQLGIQALPGTRFFINDSDYPIVVGTTGLFEIDQDSGIQIVRLYFEEKSLDLIADNPAAILIIDTIEEGGAV